LQIPIYKNEVNLSEQILNNTISYCSEVFAVGKSNYDKPIFSKLLSSEAQLDNFDLFPINTILVTVGWNNNDDVFDKEEVWIARFTPEDKPFNIGHNPRQIIGHITANLVVDDDFNIYEEFDKLPDKFHVLTAAVVYKHLRSRDLDLEKESAELIENIQSGNKFVSMEALFNNFDYGLISTSGEHKVVKRCDTTSFLTKKLRIYGGEGEYNGCKLGRVLRNITFSGKGLVDKPANPESIILNNMRVFAGVFSDLDVPVKIKDEHSQAIGENLKMSDKLELQIQELKSKLNDADARLREMDEEKVQAKLDAKDTEIQSLKDKTEATEDNIKDLQESVDKANDVVKAAQDEKNSINEELDKVKAELDSMKAKAKKVSRVSTLVDKNVDKTKAEEIVEKYFDLDDEKFEGIVAMQVEIVEASGQSEDNGEGNVGGEDNNGALENEDEDGEDNADAGDLNNSEEDEDNSTLASDSDENENELISSIATHFEELLGTKKEDK